MVLSKHISSIAERILTKETFPLPDRSEKNIIKIRSKAKTNAIPALERILKSTNVTTKNITIKKVCVYFTFLKMRHVKNQLLESYTTGKI